MPALLCSAPLAEPVAAACLLPTTSDLLCKKQQQQSQPKLSLNPFDLPEICDHVARHLDRHTLTVVVQVSSQWYTHWIRHLWRRVRVESATSTEVDRSRSREMLQAFPQLSKHIRHLEWIHLSSSSSPSPQDSILESIDLSGLNAETILFSSWTNDLDASTLSRFTQSSAHRLTALQMYNMAQVRGDLLKVAGTLPELRHFTLSMADRDSNRHHHHRLRSNASMASSVSSLEDSLIMTETEFTSADSLPDFLDACPQLRMIEILDLPLPIATTVALAAVPEDDQEQEDIEQEEGKEETTTQLDMPSPNWIPMLHLTTINLHATAISGPTLTALFARCPNLIKMNLGQNTPLYLSDFQVDPALVMNSLTTLTLSGCHFLDGHGYKEIFKATAKLLHLDIPQTNADDAALAVLGHQCLELTDLNLDGCHQITDQGIRDMLSHPRSSSSSNGDNKNVEPLTREKYQNHRLQCLSVSNCTELTGQGIHHILMTCGRLKSLEFQQPEIMPESLFPHTLETGDDEQQENLSVPAATTTLMENATSIAQEQDESTTTVTATVYPTTTTPDAVDTTTTSPPPSDHTWACQQTLDQLRIKNLNVLNPSQTQFLNDRLRELPHLKSLHIGGSQLELSILNGLGHQLENLYIDDLAREVDVNDVRWLLVDHTPNLTRLWCRQLIRHSEPWKIVRAARTHLKLW